MAFDITKALGDITAKPQAAKRKLEYITLHLIDPNPKNLYSMDGLPELADNIEAVGLMEPLIVKRTDFGRYTVISGHRRRAALRMIAERAENYPESMEEKIPCIVEDSGDGLGQESPEEAEKIRSLIEELKLLYANSDTRVLSSADTAMQVRRIREVLTELRELGGTLPGKLRDHVAAAAKVSASRIARLDVIENHLYEPKLRKAWEDGILGETNAYEIARYEPEVQAEAVNRYGVDWLAKQKADATRLVMENSQTTVRENKAAEKDWNRNVETMRQASPADSFSAEAYLAQRAKEDEAFCEMLEDRAMMFFRELDEHLCRQAGIETLKKKFGSNHVGGTTLSGIWYECMPKGLRLRRPQQKLDILRTWTEVYDRLCIYALYWVGQLQEIDAAAAIYEDESPEWRSGDPEHDGRYLCMVDLGTGVPHEQRCEYQDGEWLAYGSAIDDAFKVVRWYELPDRPTSWARILNDGEEVDDE